MKIGTIGEGVEWKSAHSPNAQNNNGPNEENP
jgi:hypothetical protein